MNQQIGMSIPFPRPIQILVGLNLVVWLFFQVILQGYFNLPFNQWFAFYPGKVLFDGMLWQVVTYQFLHSIEIGHLVLNLLMIWFLGGELVNRWGARRFYFYYLGCGVGAALLYLLVVGTHAFVSGASKGLIIPVVGASGSVFGLLVAFGLLYGERVFHFMMIFPMKAKYFVMILGGIEVLSLLSQGIAGGEVAHLAHLGGLVAGFLSLKGPRWMNPEAARFPGQKSGKKSKPSLRLVVNNDRNEEKKPKYWN